eukprot:10791527-Ditylum_brightwellii.AAC.1
MLDVWDLVEDEKKGIITSNAEHNSSVNTSATNTAMSTKHLSQCKNAEDIEYNHHLHNQNHMTSFPGCSPLPTDAALPSPPPPITPKTSRREAWVTEYAGPYARPYNPRQQREKTWWGQTKPSFADKENNEPNVVTRHQQQQ